MLILHGSWLVAERLDTFFFWGETATESRGRRRGRPKTTPAGPQDHPAQATPARLRSVAPLLASAQKSSALARLPTCDGAPISGAPAADQPSAELALGAWRIEGLALAPSAALAALVAWPDDAPPGVLIGADLQFWMGAARFALELLARQRYVPALEERARTITAHWQPVWVDADEQARFQWLVNAMPPACRVLRSPARPGESQSGGGVTLRIGPAALLSAALKAWVDQQIREWAGATQRSLARRLSNGPTRAWVEALFSAQPQLSGASFQLSGLVEQVARWLEDLQQTAALGFRVSFQVETPAVMTASNDPSWTVRYMLQATDDPSLQVPADQVWQEAGGALMLLNRRLVQPQERLLSGLVKAARLFPPFEQTLRHARPTHLALDTAAAYGFLREAAPLLEQSGFGVLTPPWWQKRAANLGVRLNLRKKQTATESSGLLSFDKVVEYDWQLALGDEPLTLEQFQKLAALKSPLVQVRGQWVEFRPEQVEAAIRFWEKRRAQGDLSLLDALRLSEGGGQEGADGLPIAGITLDGWLDEIMTSLKQHDRIQPLAAPPGFVGALRPYQARGLAWLVFLRRIGLNGCLADDMGLGKTIQTIGMVLHVQTQERPAPVLLICPTSVVGNWQREIARFAPSLRTHVHQGAGRLTGADFSAASQQAHIVISSYSLLARDRELLQQVAWGDVILDEAQNIKNAATKQAQAARSLTATHRLALTGTPVENRLSELWSLMEFLNPGYLGSQSAFRSKFTLPIERYHQAEPATQLKGLVQPLLLRRLKTDPTIIQDLPEKNEMKVFCNLTAEQATLYEAVVQDSLRQIAESEGMQRRGLVLSTLMKLKQVCNHPAHFLGDRTSTILTGRSGKLNRLSEMLEEVLAVADRALIFTQFTEMGEMLVQHLTATFGEEPLYLHGGVPARQRDEIVARFQHTRGPRVFVLSLKAGGVGLNLTEANHVFHFDRWWNPAVEDQATDRAFRIGQRRNVQVHKFICAGTLEEKIEQLIESKKGLANQIVGAGESWLTELSTDQLHDLLILRQETVADEEGA